MPSHLFVGFGFRRLAISLATAAMVAATTSCGPSDDTVVKGIPGSSKLLKEEDMYRYSGTGKAKTKVFLTPQERRALRYERAKEAEQP
jgi:hypothetical protein